MTEQASSSASPVPRRSVTRTSASQRLLRSPLAVLGATLACFLVVLALLTHQVLGGRQSLPATASSALVVHKGGKVLRTTASGRVLEEAPSSASSRPGEASGALLTRTSGGRGGEDD